MSLGLSSPSGPMNCLGSTRNCWFTARILFFFFFKLLATKFPFKTSHFTFSLPHVFIYSASSSPGGAMEVLVESAWFPLPNTESAQREGLGAGNRSIHLLSPPRGWPVLLTLSTPPWTEQANRRTISILLRCPWSPPAGPGVAVPGGVRGQEDAQSPPGPEEGKGCLDTSDSTFGSGGLAGSVELSWCWDWE